ncbi:hypothetical protein EVAR_18316_1 [Eumeta japonica]|uniref:Uncharacterized protein n=1 Tax=Eumeta variegata TaxID=151549 RepID=A0A4C1V8J7_EUMVA|nr:hypothetical protein EVAR_18316_1 [Eumeta japonica]
MKAVIDRRNGKTSVTDGLSALRGTKREDCLDFRFKAIDQLIDSPATSCVSRLTYTRSSRKAVDEFDENGRQARRVVEPSRRFDDTLTPLFPYSYFDARREHAVSVIVHDTA